MKLSINSLKPQDFFNEFFWKNEVKNGDEFAKAVQIYAQDLQANLNQSEKAIVANVLKPFFQSLGFTAVSEKAQNAVSTQSAIDLVLEKDGEPLVIIEAKKHGSSDFISEFEANKKALQECILYYFRERENGNSSLKNIIITDFYGFYIFRASEFEELFYKNKELEKLYKNFTNPSSFYKGNTDEFYKDCEKILNSENFLNKLKNKSGSLFDENIESEAKPQIKALHFDIRNFDATKEKKSKAFYKAFSRDFLLGEFSYDPNKISKKFYDELLYILGLKEQQGGSLQPNGVVGSLYENIFARLSTPSFEIAMQLIILWLNRILFLKLIETNLLNFNKNSVGGGLTTIKI